ncbi:MAG: NAD(P)/FAD-dependent oxidoreductase [Candidatus Heimdallarchaeaceae archaeon]
MRKIDVVIIGGGPAGLTAAYQLSKEGFSPLVFEEHDTIGEPVQCGEGISSNLIEDFPFLTQKKDFIIREFKVTQIHFPGDTTVFGDTHALMIKRNRFDQLLAEHARKNGTEIYTSSKIIKAVRKVDGIELIAKNSGEEERYFSQIVIIGEGPRAQIAKSLGFVPPTLIKALEYRVKGEYSNQMEFYFDAKKYPYGYCWIFPRKGETNIGIVTTAKDRKRRLDEFLKERGIEGEIVKKIGGSIPMKGPVRKFSDDRVILIGDTAGMTNPIFYGGIRSAMISGQVAGSVVAEYLKKKDMSKINLKEYDNRIKKYPFMSTLNLKCHEYFYSRPNDFLRKIGTVFDGKFINRIEKLEILNTLGKLLLNPALLKNPRKLYWLYKGFKIARDYGF